MMNRATIDWHSSRDFTTLGPNFATSHYIISENLKKTLRLHVR